MGSFLSTLESHIWDDRKDYYEYQQLPAIDTAIGIPGSASTPFVFRPWQQQLADELDIETDLLTVKWYVDEIGCTGKTIFRNHTAVKWGLGGLSMMRAPKSGEHNIVSNSKLYKNWKHNVFIMKISKCDTHTPEIYDFLQRVIDDMNMSSLKKGPRHVVVFAPFFPDMTKLSEQRWDIRSFLSDAEVSSLE